MHCRLCNHPHLSSIIPLGKMPLANALTKEKNGEQNRLYNLEVLLCDNCSLAQLKETVDPEVLFKDYPYFTSNSQTMLESSRTLALHLAQELSDDSLVMEVASNDGYLIKNYLKEGIKVLGIDPAENIAKVANQEGIPTLCAFFNATLARQLAKEGKMADVIHANNVMAHIPEINDFIQGIKTLLKPGGKGVIEVPYFLDLVEKLEFDTIYHEHVFYFSIKPLKRAFEKWGLELFAIEKIPLHGGSLRLFVGHQGDFPIDPLVSEMEEIEQKKGLHSKKTYQVFMKQVNQLKEDLLSCLNQLKEQGKKIAAYGASAKGTTLLNYFGISSDMIDFVVDKSPHKIGLFTPGTGLLIKDPSEMQKVKADAALLLAWNFAEEILREQKHYIDQGGSFILPLPEVKVIP